MVTYLVLNVVFILAVIVLLRIPIRRPSRTRCIIAAVLLSMTAVFDSVLVGLGIVGYDTTKILQVYIGAAPVEDFFYTILAVIVIPYLWQLFERKQ